jgi:putative membrane protein
MLENTLVAIHVMANLVWIGTIASVGWLTAAASKQNNADAGKLALNLYLRAAVPAFLASFTFGVSRLLLAPKYYMTSHWFHGKLTAVIIVIALHHVIGAKAKKVAAGSMQAGRSGGILVGALLAAAFLSVACVVLKQLLVP